VFQYRRCHDHIDLNELIVDAVPGRLNMIRSSLITDSVPLAAIAIPASNPIAVAFTLPDETTFGVVPSSGKYNAVYSVQVQFQAACSVSACLSVLNQQTESVVIGSVSQISQQAGDWQRVSWAFLAFLERDSHVSVLLQSSIDNACFVPASNNPAIITHPTTLASLTLTPA
jgi:hypothetical protein